ncbi:ATP-binding protein [Vaccinium witches'-broom phytoplasma]|uniref:ATP-binding protein n=1 Tax=Vaccinium witches'-broom phytoplasma TaxID=85642 RepID=UPI0003671D01|nr:SbcC/MukB-like Walker B domain-containing protein [Vaccinium witches'-broom phytoplasma]
MKKLTKIQLVNWHLFSSQTIEITGNTLISGENGAGKSTLLDALQYVLIGERKNVKFNLAANANAKRSLESYMRGKIGAENKEFLRNGDVITHIALEFLDEETQEHTILGCVLELPQRGVLKERFYLYENIALKSDLFISNNKPKNHKQLAEYLRAHTKDFSFFDTKTQYKQAVGKYLNINVAKYLEILPKALAFTPLNLQNFVFDFLLEENPINISSLKNSVRQLKKIESQIELDKKKLQQLIVIIDAEKKFKFLDEQIKINFLVEKKVLIAKYHNNLENMLVQKEQEALKTNHLLEEKQNINASIENLNNHLLQLHNNHSQGDLSQLFYSLQKELSQKQTFCQDLQGQIVFFQERLQAEQKILKEFYCLQPDDIIHQTAEEIARFLTAPKPFDIYPELKKTMLEMTDYLSQEILNFNIVQNDIQKDIKFLQQQIADKNSTFQAMNNIAKIYNPNVKKLVTLLNEKLSLFYKKEIHIHPFCELIDINDELWRNSIEGFLGSRKFNLIVEAGYFDQALKIYEKFQASEKIYDVGLVNVDKIPDLDDNPHSLADKITSNHKDALKYAKLLLSHIICETDVTQLKNHKTAITPQGMIYSSYTAKQLNPKSYQIPYIGNESKEIRKKILLSEINTLKDYLNQKQNIFMKNKSIIELMKKSKVFSLVNNDQFTVYKKLSDNEQEIVVINHKIEQFRSQQNVEQIEDNLQKIKKDKQILNESLDLVLLKIVESKNKYNMYEEKINFLQKRLAELQKDLYVIEQKEVVNLEKASIQLQNYLTTYQNNYEYILHYIQNHVKTIEKQKNTQNLDLTKYMTLYIETYHLSTIEAKLEYFDYFVQEYNLISSKNLITYEQEAKELSSKTEMIFKEEFVNKLKESIENAKQQIKKLNELLKNRPFGDDSYQIITKASDDPEYKKYYSMIVEDNLTQEINLFSENSSSYKDILLDELFQKIIYFEEGYEAIAYEFLDYRNYLTYDIQINDIYGNVSLFSKIFREKSGGETQVPFYIIIGICFEQLLSENTVHKGCLVLFDEAFNNMDENRIESMMYFFKQLNIQFLIAIPPQRIADISPYVTTNLIIVKDNNHVMVESFTKLA